MAASVLPPIQCHTVIFRSQCGFLLYNPPANYGAPVIAQ